ncbi:sugar porter (SP) family MFS transporter [Thermoflavifilum aggregans]|uniref:Sugar porter (SP) family MFS transporter n=1 Tax=Thermoflavifilum aggregans TaxID=454188 RepID=A0A2M9CRU7_9BACT|nr:sugar porter family MFS transporter [Thermoflavifilum aggregans]PJJ74624.1 sugar porter (SP) family MFS transporter [Thermoflavifilum aggregans]
MFATYRKAVGYALIAALGGFLFGFDTAVISGVEKTIQQLWQLSNLWHGFTVSAALFGTAFGALFAGRPAERFGRKKMLQVIGFLYAFTSIATALSHHWIDFIVFRFLGGLAVGASSVVGPMYISEISPARLRGRLVGFFQLNVVVGILVAFLSNYFLMKYLGPGSWRLMLGVQAVPALIFFALVFAIPESPRWLVGHDRLQQAREVLLLLQTEQVDEALAQIKNSLQHRENLVKEKLWQKKYARPIAFAMLLAMFNQLSGINAILYYAPRIFEMTGIQADVAFLQAMCVGITNLIFTLIAMSLIDRFGRKTLLIIGSIGMIVFLGLTSVAFFHQVHGGFAVMGYLIGFIAFFAFSQGAVIWVFISEIFPNRVRSKGQAIASTTHWTMDILISWLFPWMAATLGGGISFLIFSGMMALQLIFVWQFLPETKGKSLEEIQAALHIDVTPSAISA